MLAEAKGGAAWLDADTMLLSSAFGGDGMATQSGYARTVRLWRRGEAPGQVLFETDAANMGVSAVAGRNGERRAGVVRRADRVLRRCGPVRRS